MEDITVVKVNYDIIPNYDYGDTCREDKQQAEASID